MAALKVSVSQATLLIDNLEALWLSSLANYTLHEHKSVKEYGALEWAVYHDLRHAGLLTVAYQEDTSDAASELYLRALTYAMNNNPVWPSEAQGGRVDASLQKEI